MNRWHSVICVMMEVDLEAVEAKKKKKKTLLQQGFELRTSRLRDQCSSQLRYCAIILIVELKPYFNLRYEARGDNAISRRIFQLVATVGVMPTHLTKYF